MDYSEIIVLSDSECSCSIVTLFSKISDITINKIYPGNINVTCHNNINPKIIKTILEVHINTTTIENTF